MRISQVAAQVGLSSKTIRYYENEGIIPPADRGVQGYREYSAAQIEALCFIKRARELGFSLSESRDLLQLSLNSERTSAEVKAKVLRHLEKIEQQIVALEQRRAVLSQAAKNCTGDANPECPILDLLARRDVGH